MDKYYIDDPTPTAVVIGMLGIGKSTLMNRIAGGDNKFKTSGGMSSCTQQCSIESFNLKGKKFNVIDTPGLNDLNMNLDKWTQMFSQFAVAKSKISLVIMAFKATIRPTTEDKSNIITLFEAVKGIKPENIAICFTFCDKTHMTLENIKSQGNEQGWLDLIKGSFKNQDSKFDGLFKMKDENFIFFRGEEYWDKHGQHEKTTTKEIQKFIIDISPQVKTLQLNDDLRFLNIAESTAANCDVTMVNSLADLMEAEHKKHKDQIDTLNAEQKKQLYEMQESYDLLMETLKKAGQESKTSCFTYGTEFLTQHKDNVQEFTKLEALQIGDMVLVQSLDKTTKSQLHFQPIVYIDDHSIIASDIFTISTSSLKVQISAGHKMPVVKRQENGMDDIEYKLAEDLTEGEQVMIVGSKGYTNQPIMKIERETFKTGVANFIVNGDPIARRPVNTGHDVNEKGIVCSVRHIDDGPDLMWALGYQLNNTFGPDLVGHFCKIGIYFTDRYIYRTYLVLFIALALTAVKFNI